MRITLLTIGAQGDTAPFVALAVRLMRCGHTVRLAARPDFAGLAADYGVEFVPLGHPYRPFITGAAAASALGPGHPLRKVRYGIRQRRYFSDQISDDAWRAAEGAEAIIYKYSWLTGYTIAERLGVPRAAAMPFPLTPTREFPAFLLGNGADRGPVGNRLAWATSEQAVWQLLRGEDSRLRRELGLQPLPLRGPLRRQRDEALAVYYAYSPAVLPRPADWPARMQVTGYWFLDPPPGWRPAADLLRFLESGPPPVSVGFGSMASADQKATLATVLRALDKSGQRGLLLSGWAGLGQDRCLPPHVLRAGGIPHAWLFPRMAAVVHHGGAGTTGAALRSGVPSVVLPLAADQPSWARIVHSLGAGPAPIPFHALTAERLAGAITEAVSSEPIRQRAAELGRQVRAEDGTGRAVELFLRDVVGSRRNDR